MTEDITISRAERQQQEYYDSIAVLYDEHYASPSALKYRYWVYDLALKHQQLTGRTALDAMCGGGEATGYLMARGANVVGLDISAKCCDVYTHRYPEAKIVCSSILQNGFPDSHFDLVVTDSLHHLFPYVDEAVVEIHRILKPGGHFCCWEPNSNSLPDYFRRIWYRLDRKFFRDNEQSIDILSLERTHRDRFKMVSIIYGGNLAYLFVNCSMAFRIPPGFVQFYASTLMSLEKTLTHFPNRLLSLWVLCLMKKTAKD